MKKFIDILLGFIVTFSLFAIWILKMAVMGDVPVNVTFSDFTLTLNNFIFLGIIYTCYVLRTESFITNLIFIAPSLFVSSMDLYLSITDKFQSPYVFELNIINFTTIIIPTFILIFKYIKTLKIKKTFTKPSNA